MKNRNLYLYDIMNKSIKIFNVLVSHTWDDEDELASIEIYEGEGKSFEEMYRSFAGFVTHLRSEYSCEFNIDEALEALELINRRSELLFKLPVNHLALKKLTANDVEYLDLNKLHNILTAKGEEAHKRVNINLSNKLTTGEEYEREIIKQKGLENKKYNFLISDTEVEKRMPLGYKTFRERINHFIDAATAHHPNIREMLLFALENYLSIRDVNKTYKYTLKEFEGELDNFHQTKFLKQYINQLPVLFYEVLPSNSLDAIKTRINIKYSHILVEDNDE